MKHYKKSIKRIRRRKNKTKRGGATFNPIRQLKESMYEMKPSFLKTFIQHSTQYVNKDRRIQSPWFNQTKPIEDIKDEIRIAKELLTNNNYLEHHKLTD